MVILFVILCKINDDLLLIFLFFAHPQMQINYFFYNFAGPSPVDKLVFTFVHTILESSDGIFDIQNKLNLAILTFEYCGWLQFKVYRLKKSPFY